MARLITARDIDLAAASGRRDVSFEAGAIVTFAARERAKSLGVTIVESKSPIPATPVGAPAVTPISDGNAKTEYVPSSAESKAATTTVEGYTAYFENPLLDDILAVMMEISANVWVVKDRLRVLEDALVEDGIIASDRVERHQTPPDRALEIRAKRNAYIDRIYERLKH